MQAPLLHHVHQQQLWLSGQRSVFWEEQNTLIVSDLHFGKTGHFRKAGIPVPQSVYKEDLQRLVHLLHHFSPRQLLVVGDFFHSHANMELDWFRKWRAGFPALEILLVKGNHDILHRRWYAEADITLIEKEWQLGPFLFTHDRCEDRPESFTFCGHIHPGILLNGLGRQSLRFPCFYFTDTHCILPAFSRFTGVSPVSPRKSDQVFAIVENKVLRMQ